MSYYQHHIFFCLNQRENGDNACAQHGAQAAFDHCKARVKAEGLAGPAARVSTRRAVWTAAPAGRWRWCTRRAPGTASSIEHDIDEIVDSHLKHGRVVERLLLAPDVGR